MATGDRKYVAVGNIDRRDLKITTGIKSNEISFEKGKTTHVLLPHTAATIVKKEITTPPNTKVSPDLLKSWNSVTPPYGIVPTHVEIDLHTGVPHQPVVVASLHEGKPVGVQLDGTDHDGHVHVAEHDTILKEPTTILYTDRNGSLKTGQLPVRQETMPNHNAQGLAIAAGEGAIAAGTGRGGRVVTTPESALAQFATKQGYVLKELSGTSAADGATHIIEAPKKSGLPTPTPDALVEQALKSLRKTSPPNIALLTKDPATAVITVGVAPRVPGTNDEVVTTGAVEAYHTHKDRTTGHVTERLHHVTHKRHTAGGLDGEDDDEEEEEEEDGSGSGSDSGSDSGDEDNYDDQTENGGDGGSDDGGSDDETPSRKKSKNKKLDNESCDNTENGYDRFRTRHSGKVHDKDLPQRHSSSAHRRENDDDKGLRHRKNGMKK